MRNKIAIVVLALGLGISTGASAAESLISEKDIGGKFSANVGFVTEYFFRGLSQTNNKMAIQGGLDFAHDSGFSLGVWGSNVEFNDGNEASAEVDVYGGWSTELGKSKVTLSLGAIGYLYPGASSALDYDFYEINAGLSKDFGFASGSVKVSWSPEFFANSGEATYLEAAIGIPAGKYFTINLHGGYQWIDNNAAYGVDDYFDYSIGVGFALFGLDAKVAYIGTDLDNDDETLIASISKSF